MIGNMYVYKIFDITHHYFMYVPESGQSAYPLFKPCMCVSAPRLLKTIHVTRETKPE